MLSGEIVEEMQTGFYRNIVFAWCRQKISLSECVMDVKIFLCFRAHVLIDFYVWFCVSLDDGQAVYCTLITKEAFLSSYLPISLSQHLIYFISIVLCSKVVQHSAHGWELFCYFFFIIPEFDLMQTIQISLNWNSCNYSKLHFLLYF